MRFWGNCDRMRQDTVGTGRAALLCAVCSIFRKGRYLMKKKYFISAAACGAVAVCALYAGMSIKRGADRKSQVQTSAVYRELTTETRENIENTMANIYESQGMKAVNDTVTVTADALRCRTSPTTSEDNVKRSVSGGTVLSRLYEGNGWSVVKVEGKEYYVSSAYLKKGDLSKKKTSQAGTGSTGSASASSKGEAAQSSASSAEIGLDSSYQYAGFSKINSGKAVLYKSTAANKKGKTIAVNAGHGTSGGSSVKTQCHPDGSAKVTGGSTAAGATTATAVSGGMTFLDGTSEAKVTLQMAKILKDRLLAEGYDVLMLRDGEDVQLDNIARTVIANHHADCHLSLHWDSTSNNKGCFYMSVPNNTSYRSMEPVASHWESHNRLGEALVNGLKGAGNKIFSNGAMEMDLTQTSYSTIPSVDIELGDRKSSHTNETLNQLADGLVAGINGFFAE